MSRRVALDGHAARRLRILLDDLGHRLQVELEYRADDPTQRSVLRCYLRRIARARGALTPPAPRPPAVFTIVPVAPPPS